MSILLRDGNRSYIDITVWELGEGFDRNGNHVVLPPRVFKGEMQLKTQTFITADGKQTLSEEFIVSLDDIEEDSYILKGVHTELKPPSSARQIKAKRERVFMSKNIISYKYML